MSTVVGPVAVVVIAWATAGITDAMQIANVALVLAAVTVAVALSTPVGGAATSVAGALALNVFHTEPVGSLRIHDAGGIVTVFVLGALGLGVSTVTEHRIRSAARDGHVERAALARAALAGSDHAPRNSLGEDLTGAPLTRAERARAEMAVEAPRPVVDVWNDVVTACSADLALVDCRVATAADGGLPHISLRRTVIDDDARFVLPATGAIVELPDPRLGLRLVLVPRPGWGAVHLDRRAVTAFVDHAGLALTPLDR